MPLTRRYFPSHPPGESASFVMDFSAIVPWGMVLVSGALAIFKNTNPPAVADADWVKGTVLINGRALACQLAGGVGGADYLLQWTATDNRANIWVRAGAVLCTATS